MAGSVASPSGPSYRRSVRHSCAPAAGRERALTASPPGRAPRRGPRTLRCWGSPSAVAVSRRTSLAVGHVDADTVPGRDQLVAERLLDAEQQLELEPIGIHVPLVRQPPGFAHQLVVVAGNGHRPAAVDEVAEQC